MIHLRGQSSNTKNRSSNQEFHLLHIHSQRDLPYEPPDTGTNKKPSESGPYYHRQGYVTSEGDDNKKGTKEHRRNTRQQKAKVMRLPEVVLSFAFNLH